MEPKNREGLQMRYLACTLLFLILLAGCQMEDAQTLKVAASSVPHAEILEKVKPLLEEQGIHLEVVVIDDYQLPNRALAEGEVDANYFQHLPFLNQQIQELGYPLAPLAEVHLEPMGLYSTKIETLGVPENSVVLIPNDPSNLARALLLLEKAELITLKKRDLSATLLDIESNPLNLQLTDVDAPLLPRSMQDAFLAAIPANYALQSSLPPPIFVEESDSLFVNLLVVRKDEVERVELQALKNALQSDELKEWMEKQYRGGIIPLNH